MEIGKSERRLVEQSYRTGMPLPDRIQNAPELAPQLRFFYNAFHELSSDRKMGANSMGPIPWTAMDRYCERYELEEEQAEDLFHHVARLDRTYIEWQGEKTRKELEQNNKRMNKPSAPRRPPTRPPRRKR